jgi:hypothetical protein
VFIANHSLHGNQTAVHNFGVLRTLPQNCSPPFGPMSLALAKNTKMKNILIGLIVSLSSFHACGGEVYPSLFDVQIGKPFDHPRGQENKDINRPTTQFRVPNYGKTSVLFPEYQVSYLNKNYSVSIVTAESVSKSMTECMHKKEEALKLLKPAFPKYSPTPQEKSNLGGSNEFSASDENTYFVFQCQQSYGPFSTLHIQFRGVAQDKELKDAWNAFFNK